MNYVLFVFTYSEDRFGCDDKDLADCESDRIVYQSLKKYTHLLCKITMVLNLYEKYSGMMRTTRLDNVYASERTLQTEIQCIMDNGHIAHPFLNVQWKKINSGQTRLKT